MLTEEDLRATFRALEHETPHTGNTLAGLDRRRRRRTIRRRTLAMAAVVAVTAGSLAAPSVFNEVGPTGRADGPWVYRFAVDHQPGTMVRYHTIDKDYESATLYTEVEPFAVYEISVFHTGAYAPVKAPPARQVDVNGKPGFFHPTRLAPTLAWEYAPNAWAIVYTRFVPSPLPADLGAQLVRVAGLVHTDRRTPLTLPFRVGVLPGGLTADRVALSADSAGRIAAIDVRLRATDQANRNLRISVLPRFSDGGPLGDPVPNEDMIITNLGPFEVGLFSGHEDEPRFTADELTRIAKTINPVGDINDPSTWIPATLAIPIG